MAFDPRIPYNDLPTLPPRLDLESKEVLRQCLRATRALAELKGAGGLIPDQSILINAIPLQEAKLSSEIENIVTTQDELFLAALDEENAADPQTKEVLRYRTALRQGYERLKEQRLSLDLIRDMCSTVCNASMGFRSAQEHVYIGNPSTGHVAYTPPTGAPRLLARLRNLEDYLLEDGAPDPLIRMAVTHYQFEAIHPFTDGNGRTGRILNILYLVQERLLEIPVLYLSRYIIQHKTDYHRLLLEVTKEGAWDQWLLYMLRGVEETAQWTTGRIQAIKALFDSTVERCRSEAPKAYSKELVELIFRQPYCKIGFVVEAGIAQRQTASEYLKELERIGILESEKRGRQVIYKHPALVEVLTA